MKKQKNPIVVSTRGFLTISAIVGLFCVLTGCSGVFREATETDPFRPFPSVESKEETAAPETQAVDTAAVTEAIETEEPMPHSPIENLPNTPSPEAAEWIQRYAEYKDPHTVLLDGDGIASLNEKIRSDCPTMFDMRHIPDFAEGETVRAYIEEAGTPTMGMVTADILENRNLSGITEAVIPVPAVVTARANIRNMPTSEQFYSGNDANRYYDRVQEAELLVGTPILMLHESADGKFAFVQSYYYRGWTERDRIALCSAEDYLRFLPDADGRITVTALSAEVTPDLRLDMGVTLPFAADCGDTFTALLPRRDDSGRLFTEEVTVAKTDAVYGSLPFTWANYVTQAFKHLGTAYSWGGYNGGVDCSGFVCAVLRSFGIYVPRNTGEQKLYGGEITPLSGMNDGEIKSILASISYPTALHRPGHVMLYLGLLDGTVYVIHAPSGGQKVCVMALTKLDNLTCAAVVK